MRPYETLIVLNTGLGEETAKLVARFESIVRNEGGTVDSTRDWGVRDLAYVIGKQKQGHYFLLEYQAEPGAVAELERNLRIAEGVMRYTSVQQTHTGLPEPRVYREREYSERRETPLSELRAGGAETRAAGAATEAEGANVEQEQKQEGAAETAPSEGVEGAE